MNLRLKIFFLLALLVTSCSEPKRHGLSFQNTADRDVIFSTEGIHLYAEGGGPQKLGGNCAPFVGGRYSTMGPLRIKWPVKVRWETRDGSQSGEKTFAEIPGIQKGASEITTGGILVVGISPDYQVKAFFMDSEDFQDHNYVQILEGKLPMPEARTSQP